ncbi:NHLP bacteriocin export ABC transporter permease/ATPase subunit [Falsiroseomonas sp.]|uniref:NHLP bacteriocin export ABC transporter permease/ATPase subunit n=1 Tax=Falsiroseomonas sp. TaxID=2870721 RepID=UPI003F72D17C
MADDPHPIVMPETGWAPAMAAYNDPLQLDDPFAPYRMEAGTGTLFLQALRDGQPSGAAVPLLDLGPGQFGFGMPALEDPAEPGLVHAVRLAAPPDAAVARGPRLWDLPADRRAEALAGWVRGWWDALATFTGIAGTNLLTAQAEPVVLAAGRRAMGREGRLVWVRLLAGAAELQGLPGRPLVLEPDGTPVALAGAVQVVTGPRGATLAVQDTATLLDGPRAMAEATLLAFSQAAMRLTLEQQQLREARIATREQHRAASATRRFIGALEGLGSMLRGRPAEEPPERDDALLGAFQRVADAIGIARRIVAPPPVATGRAANEDPMQRLARSNGLRSRRVQLEAGWQRGGGPAMVGFRGKDDVIPVALLPSGRGYVAVSPLTGRRESVDETLAAEIAQAAAYLLYRPLPREAPDATTLFRFALFGRQRDVAAVLAAGLLVGLLAMAPPYLTGTMLSTVIPMADLPTHLILSLGLFVVALSQFALHLVQGRAMLRLQLLMDHDAQAAIWDRLLALPSSFFRGTTVGDLSDRANAVSEIRSVAATASAEGALGAATTVFSLAMMFWYSWELSLVALGMLVVLILVTGALTSAQARRHRNLLRLAGRMEGMLHQLVSGISKLRTSGAEKAAFWRWAQAFRAQRSESFALRRLKGAQVAFNAGFAGLCTAAVLAYVGLSLLPATREADSLEVFDVAAFIAFNAAMGQLFAASLRVAAVAGQLAAVRPLFERLRPVLEAIPEAREGGQDIGAMTGALELRNVSFRYAEGGPPVVDNVSLTFQPGEFVAIVGASGSGKSSLLRLLLGFEKPSSGAVLVDGYDLATLDLVSVRRQIGTVMQDARLGAGTILDNIAAANRLTTAEALTAAKQSGLTEDLRQLPMGLYTVLPEGGGTLSGGQRQRLLIARAFAQRPRVLIFDEATSALDNRTQEITIRALESLQITRIVVAHRLSTIRNATVIHVIHRGRVAESGSFDELMAKGGLFAELAQRQLA